MRFVVFVTLIALSVCSRGLAGEQEGGVVGSFPVDGPIPVAESLFGGQIGRCEWDHNLHTTMPLGTADVFGHGPYDLFVLPNRLYPFKDFDKEGTPRYGKPLMLDGEWIHAIIHGTGGTIYGIKAMDKKVRVCKFNKETLAFEKYADSVELDIPGNLGSRMATYISPDKKRHVGMTAYEGPNGKLHVYATIPSQTKYRPPGDHHSSSFMPFDGAGFWRGGMPRNTIYHLCFSSLDLKRVESAKRIGDGPGELLCNVRAMTVLNLGADHPPALVTSEQLSVLRYFTIDEPTGSLGPQQFVNDQQHVALRHPAVSPSVRAIPDPKTGLSNLIVGEGGRLWFYRFSGKFAENGSPIYLTPAKPVMAEGAPLTLANLPVISPGDLDRDGLVDLIVGNNAGDLLFVKNVGKPDRPEFANPVFVPVGGHRFDIKAGYRGSLQGPGEATWGYTCPTVCDWDGDGQLDVILNTITGDYMFLRGLRSQEGVPAFDEPMLLYCDGLQLHLAWRSQPAVTDWGTGNRLCMIALDEKNLLRQFWRVDNQNVERGELLRLKDGSPITANVDEGAGQTGRAKLVAHDWDQDGDVDLLIGTSRGLSFPASKYKYLPSYYGPDRASSVLLLRNIGSNAEPVFDYVKQVESNGERIKLGIHSCSPAPVDLGRGVVDLLVGEEAGTVRYYPGESLTVSGPPADKTLKQKPRGRKLFHRFHRYRVSRP